MVSELSARLLKGYSISYTTSKPLAAGKCFSGFSSASSSGSSGPESQNPSLEPRSLSDQSSSMNNRSDERVTNRDACFKRRKIDELRFAASRVKEDLEKGGLPFPSIHANKPRALEGFDIDMSCVRLLSAKNVSTSPFLTTVAGKRSFDRMDEIDQLFTATRKVYSKTWTQGDDIDWDKSSAGSLTSDSEASCAVDISPLLEDALKYRTSDTTKLPAPAPLKTVCMRTALENSSEPRLVTLSFAPFLIIHASSAFTRMTGIKAKDILGKQLREVFKDKRCKAMAANVSSLASMHDQLTSVTTSRQDKGFDCCLNISLVGSDVDSVPATHCMVALHATTASSEESPVHDNQSIATVTGSLRHCEVIA